MHRQWFNDPRVAHLAGTLLKKNKSDVHDTRIWDAAVDSIGQAAYEAARDWPEGQVVANFEGTYLNEDMVVVHFRACLSPSRS